MMTFRDEYGCSGDCQGGTSGVSLSVSLLGEANAKAGWMDGVGD